jgi:hypothetical protein
MVKMLGAADSPEADAVRTVVRAIVWVGVALIAEAGVRVQAVQVCTRAMTASVRVGEPLSADS